MGPTVVEPSIRISLWAKTEAVRILKAKIHKQEMKKFFIEVSFLIGS
jgi:hypothetical protein